MALKSSPITVLQNKLTAPLAEVMQLAKVQVYQNNQLIQTFTIEEDVQIEEANIFQRLMFWFKSLFPFLSSDEPKVKTYTLG